jgi:hypothetical protein
MAITASVLLDTGVLTAIGDNLDNTITASRDAAGTILINNGAVSIAGGQPTVANTATISRIFAKSERWNAGLCHIHSECSHGSASPVDPPLTPQADELPMIANDDSPDVIRKDVPMIAAIYAASPPTNPASLRSQLDRELDRATQLDRVLGVGEGSGSEAVQVRLHDGHW